MKELSSHLIINTVTTPNLGHNSYATHHKSGVATTSRTQVRAGRLFACGVLDVFARKSFGWAIDRKADASLANLALHMAAQTRTITKGLILHMDHGLKFTSWVFTTNVTTYDIRLSLESMGDSYENAIIEAFWVYMQTELLDRRKCGQRLWNST